MKKLGGVMALALVARAAGANEPAGLWELAPPNTAWAVVVHDGSLGPVRRGWEAILASMNTSEDLAALRDSLPPVVVRAAELDNGGGLAWFRTRRGEDAFVLPVADRPRFRRTVGGLVERRAGRTLDRFDDLVCGENRGRYVCATSEMLLDELGTSRDLSAEVAAWPADLHGDVEAYAAEDTLPMADGAPVRISARLARGAIRLRAQAPGPGSAPAAPGPLEAGLAEIRPAGFLIARQWRADGWSRGLLRDLADVWTGDLVAYSLPGRPGRGVVKAGVRSGGTVRAFLRDCHARSWEPAVTLARGTAHCEARWRMPGLGEVRAEARLVKDVLIVGVGEVGSSPAAPELSPAAHDLLGLRLPLVAWGRGVYARAVRPLIALSSLERRDPLLAAASRWLLRHLVEAGVAFGTDESGLEIVAHVRTTFSYPDEIVAIVERLTARIARGDAKAFAALEELAARHPGSDLAADVASGPRP